MPIESHRVQQDFHRSAGSYAMHADVQWNILTQLVELALPYIPPDAHILDVGCGPGWLHDAAEQHSKHWWIAGVDIAEGMCAESLKRGLSVTCASAESLPFASDSFDTVLSSLCAQWLAQPQDFIKEVARILKPGGHAAIATLGPQTLLELRDSFATYEEDARIMNFLNEKEWMHIARDAGLVVTHMHSTLWHYPYTSLTKLLHTLRRIGATNKRTDRPRGLGGLELFAKVECTYEERYARPTGGIWASWQPLTLILKKP